MVQTQWTGVNDIQHLFLERGSPFASFGGSIAVSGDGNSLLVGAPTGHSAEASAGLVMSYEKHDGVWEFKEELFPYMIVRGDSFGSSLSLNYDGTLAAMGAPAKEYRGVVNAGAAFLFEKNAGWDLLRQLPWSIFQPGAGFGSSVFLNDSGDLMVASAPGYSDPGRGHGGVFKFSAKDEWGTPEKIVEREHGNALGAVLSMYINGGFFTTLCGARLLEFCLDGDAYLTNEVKIDHSAHSICVSEDGERMFLGFYNRNQMCGAVDVYVRDRGIWVFERELVADNLDELAMFGSSVACSGNGEVLVVGAPGRPGQYGAINHGQAHVFTLESGAWKEMQILGEEEPAPGNFGIVVEMSRDGREIFISNPLYHHLSQECGKVSVFSSK